MGHNCVMESKFDAVIAGLMVAKNVITTNVNPVMRKSKNWIFTGYACKTDVSMPIEMNPKVCWTQQIKNPKLNPRTAPRKAIIPPSFRKIDRTSRREAPKAKRIATSFFFSMINIVREKKTLKGVSSNYIQQNQLSDHIVVGGSELTRDGVNYALIGRGVQFTLGISPINDLQLLQVYYPRKSKSINLDPSRLIMVKHILPGGIFALEKQYDENYIIVPLDFAKELMDYGERRTSFEIKTGQSSSIEEVQQNLKATLGPDFQVLNTEEQHSDVLKVIRIEKLFVFLIFSFILIIASFNIFFSLTMLIIEKKKDVAVLFALGASRRLIRSIFLKEGGIITFKGLQ